MVEPKVKEQKPQPRRRRQRRGNDTRNVTLTATQQLMKTIEPMHKKIDQLMQQKYQDTSYTALKTHANEGDIASELQHIRAAVAGKGQQLRALAALGLKTIEQLDAHFDTATTPERMRLLTLALGDSLFNLIAPYLQRAAITYGPQVAKYVWDWAKQTAAGQKVTEAVKRYTGYNLNDHEAGPYRTLQMPDTETTGDRGPLDVHAPDYIDVDAVLGQFCPLLFPGKRMPRPLVANPSVIFSRKQLLTTLLQYSGSVNSPSQASWPLSLNSGGNVMLVIRPDAFLDAQVQAGGNYQAPQAAANVAFMSMNQSTSANFQTGDATGTTWIHGCSPLARSNQNIVESTLVSFAIRLNLVAAPLTTTGFVSVGMITDQNYVQGASADPNFVAGTDQIANMPVNFQCSLASCNGKTIQYLALGADGLRDYPNQGLVQVSQQNGYPGVIVINVQGGVPLSTPLEFELTATFEYTPNATLAPTSHLDLPTIAPMTLQLCAQIVSAHRYILANGVEEQKDLAQAILSVPPYYADVMRAATRANKGKYVEHRISPLGGVQQVLDQDSQLQL